MAMASHVLLSPLNRTGMFNRFLPIRGFQKFYGTRELKASSRFLNDRNSSKNKHQLTVKQQKMLDTIIRVDQAGELAANWIYRGQHAVLRKDPSSGPLIQAMWEQEKKHLFVMNQLQKQFQVRPTGLWEVTKIAGFGLGAVTALMGKEAAMACTEAVETVIGEHYDDQLSELEMLPETFQGKDMLHDIIVEFRDDELEHLSVAVEEHSQRAPAHALLSAVIGKGCEVAIELCKRI